MAAATRPYIITPKKSQGKGIVVVNAASQAQALACIARMTFDVVTAKAIDIAMIFRNTPDVLFINADEAELAQLDIEDMG